MPQGLNRNWLLNHAEEGEASTIAACRFFAGSARGKHSAGLVAIGSQACDQLVANFIHLLPAFSQIFANAAPNVTYGKVHWAPSFAQPYRLTKLVLRDKSLRLPRDQMESFRADPTLVAHLIPGLVAKGLDAQAELLGLPAIGLDPADVEVVSIQHLGVQPMDHKNNNRAMLPRLGQVFLKLPVELTGEWSIGPLQTYGNGRLTRQIQERAFRCEEEAPHVPAAARSEFLTLENAG